jgi:hypothetical protein
MKIKHTLLCLLPSAIAGCAFLFVVAGPSVPSAHADTVVNASFQDDTVLTDGGTNASVSNWLTVSAGATETAVTYNPTFTDYAGAAGLSGVATNMDGNQVLSFDTSLLGGTATASQTTGSLLTLNTSYTLTVSVGNPGGQAFQGYVLSILAGTNTLATTGIQYDVASGAFEVKSTSFIADSSMAALVNTPITILLTAPGALLAQSTGADFDNVQLTSAAVPEPSTYALLGIGTFGALLWTRRFRRNALRRERSR